MDKYRKKPVVIEACQWDGTRDTAIRLSMWMGRPVGGGVGLPLKIATLEGEMRCDVGDWVIRGVKGEFYPCKPDIFSATYDPAPAPTPKEE